MNFLRNFEKRIEGAMRRLPYGGAAQREPLEISRDILDEIEGKITPLGGGRRVFPFNLITVRLRAADAEQRALYEVAFVNERTLEKAVRERLRPPRCEAPAGLSVVIEFFEQPREGSPAGAFHVLYEHQHKEGPAAKRKPSGRAHLIVMQGQAEPMRYRITGRRTNVGRQTEVTDREGLPMRRNDLVFLENGGEVNQTVSRVHAHISHDLQTGEFRLHDDNSAYGTHIIREGGRRLKVTRNLGAPLRSGDEIFFGQARVIFKRD